MYDKLKVLAFRLKRVGVSSYGMKALFEILRYNALLTNDSEFKVNNSYSPHYARLLMKNEPELAGFFKIRTINA